MEDWLSTLNDKERAEWDDYVRHAREEMIPKMDASAFVMSLVPTSGKADIKFAVELGMAIMLDKPILAVVQEGIKIPEKLRLVAEEIVEVNLDGDRERSAFLISAAISRMMKKLDRE